MSGKRTKMLRAEAKNYSAIYGKPFEREVRRQWEKIPRPERRSRHSYRRTGWSPRDIAIMRAVEKVGRRER